VIIADHDAGASGADRTSLVCSAQNRPGAVYQLLAPFADNGVSMSRLESRPARGFGGSRWEYVFYIDIEGHRSEPAVARALEELRRAGRLRQVAGLLSQSGLLRHSPMSIARAGTGLYPRHFSLHSRQADHRVGPPDGHPGGEDRQAGVQRKSAGHEPEGAPGGRRRRWPASNAIRTSSN
jgi:hypothetical protein